MIYKKNLPLDDERRLATAAKGTNTQQCNKMIMYVDKTWITITTKVGRSFTIVGQ